ncbi:hypothetical protein Bhyg_10993 [Pseudolycoriella hygida]|uniref:Uncharacterized protein n=1 Tax=Pseudolycoriella hygida TaxID=35572 RepID=A0A9Q0MW51_9DIPT|nr:hypothetical protein Bhyg_10993 [Pseudolycoriella hygida]
MFIVWLRHKQMKLNFILYSTYLFRSFLTGQPRDRAMQTILKSFDELFETEK